MPTTKKSPAKSSNPKPTSAVAENQLTPPTKSPPPTASAKPKGPKSTKLAKTATGSQNLSALDAAAKVLEESNAALTTGEMIEQMSTKGYWTSPGGKTPAATLYSAILRELKMKGEASRFAKTERGKFILKK
jgi:short subunit dehydrogenase-like uncharacterized protein